MTEEGLVSRAPAVALGGVALIATVVLASAGIRLGQDDALLAGAVPVFRLVHRGAATLGAFAALVMVVLAWRGRRDGPRFWRISCVVALLTLVLAVVGAAGGARPPLAIAAVNLLGGLALLVSYAVALGEARGEPAGAGAGRSLLVPLLGLQVLLGAAVALGGKQDLALGLHGTVGVGLCGLLAWFALRPGVPAGRSAMALGAAGALLAGMTALQFPQSAAVALAHAATVALLLVAAGFALGRGS